MVTRQEKQAFKNKPVKKDNKNIKNNNKNNYNF